MTEEACMSHLLVNLWENQEIFPQDKTNVPCIKILENVFPQLKDFYNCYHKLLNALKSFGSVKDSDCKSSHQKKMEVAESNNLNEAADLVKVYQCMTCNLIFETIKEVEEHICNNYEKEINPKLKCAYCDRTYKSKSQVKLHEKTHEGTQPHKCAHCSKSFLRPSDKIKHERTHTGEQPYSCNICGKSFKQVAGLIVHERYHTGQRPYKCSLCNKSFTQDGTLKKHEKVHAGGTKPFVCDFKSCGRAFFTESDCNLHFRVHFGEKPHSCNLCSSSFKKPSELQSHINRCHKNVAYKCSVCDLKFLKASQFHVHKCEKDKNIES